MAGVGAVVLKERNEITKKEDIDEWISQNNSDQTGSKDLQNVSDGKDMHQRNSKLKIPSIERWKQISFSKIMCQLSCFVSLQSTSIDLNTLINYLAQHIKCFKTSALKAAIDKDISYATETQLYKKCLRERALSLEFERLEKYKMRVQHRICTPVRINGPIPKKQWNEFISRPILFDARIRRFDNCCGLKNCPLCSNFFCRSNLEVKSVSPNIPSPRFREIPDEKDSFDDGDDLSKQQKKLFALQEARNDLLFIRKYNQGLLKPTQE